MLDRDDAGQAAIDELLRRLGRKLWVKVISMSAGKQADQMTSEELAELLEK